MLLNQSFELDDLKIPDNGYNKQDSTAALVLLIVLVSIFVIFMNDMIAFISEAFANVLDHQKAILAREMACLIVDLYSSLSEEEITRYENECKWIYKLFKLTDLTKMKSGEQADAGEADGRRATKQDVQSLVTKMTKMRKENIEMNAKLSDMRKENIEMNAMLEKILLLVDK